MIKKAIFVAIALLAGIWLWQASPEPDSSPKPEGQESRELITVVAEGLAIPWDVDFLPSGEILVTERPGNLLRIATDKKIIHIPGVLHTGEGGLLGLAVHPDFESNHFIYVYLTARESDIINRVVRYRLDGDAVADRIVIVDGIPGFRFHDGGQLAFGPDGLLYITTGDAGQGDRAQDTNSLAGKILRVRGDGTGLEIVSYGHRNPQGLAWDEDGRLWATEHGPSGIDGGTGQDELNLIEKGKNYGWPVVSGARSKPGMESPIIQSGESETWAPAGAAFWKGNLFFAGLRGQALYEYHLGQTQTKPVFHLREYGRLRAVTLGPDNMLYVTTSNTDGRGKPGAGDDKLLRIDPRGLR